jgi:hypothetical protein
VLLGVLFVSGFVLVSLPALLRPAGRRLEPEKWAIVCRLTMALGWAAVEAALVGQAAPTILRALDVSALAAVCERVIGTWVPGGTVVDWAAFGVALGMPILAVIGIVRTRATWGTIHVEPQLGRHSSVTGLDALTRLDLAVIPARVPVAFSVSHRGRGQIVVSDGLLAHLDETGARLVLRHEAAHLRYHHHRFLLFGAAIEHAFVWLPPIRASVAAMRVALERWADEAAAGADAARRGELRGALVGVAHHMVSEPVAALWGASSVVERLEALDRGPVRSRTTQRLVTYAPVAIVGLTAAAALGFWLGELPTMVSIATCPIG